MNGNTGDFDVLNYAYATQSFICNGSNGWYILPRTDLFIVDFPVQVLGTITGSFNAHVTKIGNNTVIFTFLDFSGAASSTLPIFLDNIPNGFLSSSNLNGIMPIRTG